MEKKTLVNLNQTQIARIYNVFDFSDDEEIVDAQLVNGKTLVIHYVDNYNGTNGTYLPTTEGKEGKDKINFIMRGIELRRQENIITNRVGKKLSTFLLLATVAATGVSVLTCYRGTDIGWANT